MTRRGESRRRALIANLALIALFLAGFWQFGSGALIHAKAVVAQQLLERAWQRTLAGEEQARPWPWADTYPVARLRVPRHDIDLIVLAGASGRTLAFGPGHLLGSAGPGQPGEMLVSGHRDTHFRFLEALEPGDRIVLEGPDGSVTRYEVGGGEIVDTRTTPLLLARQGAPLSLITCYPFDVIAPTGPLRYRVRADPVAGPSGSTGQAAVHALPAGEGETAFIPLPVDPDGTTADPAGLGGWLGGVGRFDGIRKALVSRAPPLVWRARDAVSMLVER